MSCQIASLANLRLEEGIGFGLQIRACFDWTVILLFGVGRSLACRAHA